MPQGGSSQAVGYGMLLVGGIAAVAAIRGDSFKNVLSGVKSPIRPLTSTIPSSFDTPAAAGTSSGTASTAFMGDGSVGQGAEAAVKFAESQLGIKGGSKRELGYEKGVGIAPGSDISEWCSDFAAYTLKQAGVTDLPSNPAYSGSWLTWSGGQNLHTTNPGAIKPGDLLVFNWSGTGSTSETSHVAIAKGGGKMISGNGEGDTVDESSIPTQFLVGIVRPHYKGTGKGLL